MEVAIFVPIAFFLVVGWIVYILVDGSRRKERMKTFTEFYSRLLDRMQSPKDFGDFLQTPGGQRFLETLTVEKGHPIDRVLRAVQAGLVLLMTGIGFYAAGEFAATSQHWDDRSFLRVVGVILMSLGVGFLLSATASFSITKSMGMLQRGHGLDPHDLRDTSGRPMA
jgi:thiosulfate reductase cytochrome b subunit